MSRFHRPEDRTTIIVIRSGFGQVGGSMFLGHFAPKAREKYQTKEERKKLEWQLLTSSLAMVALWAVTIILAVYGLVPKTLPSSPLLAVGVLVGVVVGVRCSVWWVETMNRYYAPVLLGYTVIERANGAIHCSLEPPIRLKSGGIGYRGANDVEQPAFDLFIEAPLREGAKGYICRLIGQGKVERLLGVSVVVGHPMDDFTFDDGHNGIYRWKADVQSCHEIPLEHWLQAYAVSGLIKHMVFPPRMNANGDQLGNDEPGDMQYARRETVELLLAMRMLITKVRGRIPAEHLLGLLDSAITQLNPSGQQWAEAEAEVAADWQTIVTMHGVVLERLRLVEADSPTTAAPTAS